MSEWLWASAEPFYLFTMRNASELIAQSHNKDMSSMTNSALVFEPKCWGMGGVAGSLSMSTSVHRSPNIVWRSNSIFNLRAPDTVFLAVTPTPHPTVVLHSYEYVGLVIVRTHQASFLRIFKHWAMVIYALHCKIGYVCRFSFSLSWRRTKNHGEFNQAIWCCSLIKDPRTIEF